MIKELRKRYLDISNYDPARLYMLYDGRATGARGTDTASVLFTSRSYQDVLDLRNGYADVACYSYRQGEEYLEDEQWHWDWVPGYWEW